MFNVTQPLPWSCSCYMGAPINSLLKFCLSLISWLNYFCSLMCDFTLFHNDKKPLLHLWSNFLCWCALYVQAKYLNVLRLARTLATNFDSVVQSQRALGETFVDMSQKMPELGEEFAYNGEMQKALYKNGEILSGRLNCWSVSEVLLVYLLTADAVVSCVNSTFQHQLFSSNMLPWLTDSFFVPSVWQKFNLTTICFSNSHT